MRYELSGDVSSCCFVFFFCLQAVGLFIGEVNDVVGSGSEQTLFLFSVSRDTSVNKTIFVFQIASATKIGTSSKKFFNL